MLTLLNISSIALVDELRVEFDRGLNLLTGETGSGKSIIVDALGVLLGGRFTADLLKTGASRGFIEGLFSVGSNSELEGILAAAGIELPDVTAGDQGEANEIIIRRELSLVGKNKVFINNQLAGTQLLRQLRSFLVDIHGQGDQQTLFSTDTHLELLDAFANLSALREEVRSCYERWKDLKLKLDRLRSDEAEKLQLIDILRFQIEELDRAQLAIGEDERLTEERRRLLNIEKLNLLCAESYNLIYEDPNAALARIGQTTKRIEELSEYESRFRDYLEGLQSARAVLEELAFSLREFSGQLEFSSTRLTEIENRLAEISRLKRKYGGSIETALEHLARSEDRLNQVERADECERELTLGVAAARAAYVERAGCLHKERIGATRKFEREVERDLAEVAMERTKFQVQITAPSARELGEETVPAFSAFTARGFDRVEFYFSANVGEVVKPLAKVASGGEASRLMLVLKTVANASEFPRTIVFDEIDTGIGGRVSESVGAKLKKLAQTNQVLCVTHQPQIARFADNHLRLQKEVVGARTKVTVEKLDRRARIEELARMLTGAEITDSARRHARELLKT